MEFPDLIKAIIDLGFPIVVAIYLLFYETRQMERYRQKMHEVKIGLYLMLDRLNVLDEYEKAIKEYQEKKDKDKE